MKVTNTALKNLILDFKRLSVALKEIAEFNILATMFDSFFPGIDFTQGEKVIYLREYQRRYQDNYLKMLIQ